MDANPPRKPGLPFLTMFSEYFGFSRLVSLAVVVLMVVIIGFTVFWFIHINPPRSITMISGPSGSSYERYAERYRDILAKNGVTLKILNSAGSAENLEKLEDR